MRVSRVPVGPEVAGDSGGDRGEAPVAEVCLANLNRFAGTITIAQNRPWGEKGIVCTREETKVHFIMHEPSIPATLALP